MSTNELNIFFVLLLCCKEPNYKKPLYISFLSKQANCSSADNVLLPHTHLFYVSLRSAFLLQEHSRNQNKSVDTKHSNNKKYTIFI